MDATAEQEVLAEEVLSLAEVPELREVLRT